MLIRMKQLFYNNTWKKAMILYNRIYRQLLFDLKLFFLIMGNNKLIPNLC